MLFAKRLHCAFTGCRNARGQSLVETVIIIPLVLLVVLGILQLILILEAYQIIDYASFMAARSAVVFTNQPSHRIIPGMYNYELVARYLCIPLAGRSGDEFHGKNRLLQAFQEDMFRYIDREDRGIITDLFDRAGYCFDAENMTVILTQASGGDLANIPMGKPVTVEIQFRLPLVMPIVNRLFDPIDGSRDDTFKITRSYSLLKEREIQQSVY
jgi:hypothetical protein